MRYSIVIPAYNEGGNIGRTVEALLKTFPGCEVVVVDDGSADETAAAAESSGATVIRHGVNRGKGAAVRTGFAAACGEVVGFVDADGSTELADVKRVFEAAQAGGVAIASRRIPGSVIPRDQPPHRRVSGLLFRALTRLFTGLTIVDTQCGCKALRRDAALRLMPLMQSDGFEFDVELLYLAKREGYSITELPVCWTANGRTRVSVLRDAPKMLRGIAKVGLRRSR